MKILLNGEQKDCEQGCSIAHLLALLELQGKRLAVEVNQEVIPKAEHEAFILSEDDKIEIIQAVGGG